jgi:hypothetical protein
LAIGKSPRLISETPRRQRLPLPGPGILLECTQRGTLVKIRRDELNLLHGVSPGISFTHLLHRESLDKGFTFLSELKKRGSAFGWELKFSLSQEVAPLFVGGAARDSSIIIFGTQTRAAFLGFSSYFLNPSLQRAINRVIQEHVRQAAGQTSRESALHEELNCANDKLVSLRRVLAKKNSSLKRVKAELQEARNGIQSLRNLLPICSCCKKIRDEQGSWSHVENYFMDHSGVQFTHSICPECVQALYPGLAVEK